MSAVELAVLVLFANAAGKWSPIVSTKPTNTVVDSARIPVIALCICHTRCINTVDILLFAVRRLAEHLVETTKTLQHRVDDDGKVAPQDAFAEHVTVRTVKHTNSSRVFLAVVAVRVLFTFITHATTTLELAVGGLVHTHVDAIRMAIVHRARITIIARRRMVNDLTHTRRQTLAIAVDVELLVVLTRLNDELAVPVKRARPAVLDGLVDALARRRTAVDRAGVVVVAVTHARHRDLAGRVGLRNHAAVDVLRSGVHTDLAHDREVG